MSDEAPAAPGRVIRVTPKDTSGVFRTRQLFAVSVGDDQQPSPTSSGRIPTLTWLWRLLEIFARSLCGIWVSSPVCWFSYDEEMEALNPA